ncbi:hypothetical protein L208DRAFT_1306173 [Tricholoma matsutake]|nr:hypothetical protein L208DRAFT_1306173 [Tricholoma matsutake 945]
MYSHSHQGYYTAKSRGVSTASTLILNSFHPSQITGGGSGALQQEFRELELLDDVTTRHFEGKLLRNVAMANRRNMVITPFCEHKGLQYMPSTIHSALRWSKHDPYLEWEGDNLDWQIVEAKPKKKYQAKQQPESSYTKKIELAHVLKKTPSLDLCQPHCLKKRRLNSDAGLAQNVQLSVSVHALVPIGTQWQNNSCAYDAICTILFNVWLDDPQTVSHSWHEMRSDLLDSLLVSFNSHVSVRGASATYSLEQI